MTKPLVLDLFAGGGGFTLGAAVAGFDVACFDNDEDLTSAHSTNFPHFELILSDLGKLAPADALGKIDKQAGDISGIIGGPPCQGFSSIGRRDPTDPRNTLVDAYFNFVKVISPPFFVFENVPGILQKPHRERLLGSAGQLEEEYTILGPAQVNALEFGAATDRRRVIVLGFKRTVHSFSGAGINGGKVCHATVRDAISDLPPPRSRDKGHWGRYRSGIPVPETSYAGRLRSMPPEGLSCQHVRDRHQRGLVSGLKETAHNKEVKQRFKKVKPGKTDPISKYPRLAWGCPSPTLRAGTGRKHGCYQAARPIHPSANRVITVREAARLQGFPDWFQFNPTIWHSFRMIGNSVSPFMATELLRRCMMFLRESTNRVSSPQTPTLTA